MLCVYCYISALQHIVNNDILPMSAVSSWDYWQRQAHLISRLLNSVAEWETHSYVIMLDFTSEY